MYMEPEEIVIAYREARDPRNEIIILSQLNACQPSEIISVLRDNGISTNAKIPDERIPACRDRRLNTAEAEKLYNNGLFDYEIAEVLATSKNAVLYWRRKNGLQANRFRKTEGGQHVRKDR